MKYTDEAVYYSQAEQSYIDLLSKSQLEKDTDNRLAGVVFELSTDENFQNIIATKTTDLSGKAIFDHLEKGTYYIREKQGLSFYVKSDEICKVTISQDQQVETVKVKNDLITSYVNIQKVDKEDHNKKLTGAEFTMYADEACTKAIKTTTTDQQGIAHFEGIKFGTTVYIKETKAPKGYELSDKLIKVTIDEAWVLGNKTKTIQFSDEVIPKTPNTGDTTNTSLYILLLQAALICFIFAAYSIKTKKAIS